MKMVRHLDYTYRFSWPRYPAFPALLRAKHLFPPPVERACPVTPAQAILVMLRRGQTLRSPSPKADTQVSESPRHSQ